MTILKIFLECLRFLRKTSGIHEKFSDLQFMRGKYLKRDWPNSLRAKAGSFLGHSCHKEFIEKEKLEFKPVIKVNILNKN